MIFIMEIPQNCTCSCHDSVVDFYRILFDSKKQFPGLEIKTLPLYKSQRQSIITIKLLCKKKSIVGPCQIRVKNRISPSAHQM
jgi:hypothetical protein